MSKKSRYVSQAPSAVASRMVYTTDARANAVLRGAQRNDEAQDRYDRIIESRYPPYRLHTHQIAAIDYGAAYTCSMGAPETSPELDRYLKRSEPRSVAVARRLWIEWWRLPYVIGRLTATFGQKTVDAVLALERDGIHPRELERRLRLTLKTISEMKGRVMRFVRRLLPYEYYDNPALLSQAMAD